MRKTPTFDGKDVQDPDTLNALGAKLADLISLRRDSLIRAARTDLAFTEEAANAEVDLTISHLRNIRNVHRWVRGYAPICRPEQFVSLMMPYNCVAWPIWDAACVAAAGNRVRVRMSSRAGNLCQIVDSILQEALPGTAAVSEDAGAKFIDDAFDSDASPLLIAYGSERTGEQLLSRSQANPGIKVVFEGPGKDPVIVMHGSDPDRVAAQITQSKLEYSGQQCISPEILLVDRRLHDALVERIVRRFESVVVGDPSDPATEVGPMGSPRVPLIIQEQLVDAIARGATFACGGKVDGSWVQPTVVVGVSPAMSVFQEESFGPVLAVASFSDSEEAHALAGATRFGLHCTIHGEGATALAASLVGSPYAAPVESITFGKFGTTSIDGPLSFDVADGFRPYGGFGKSGWISSSGRLLQGPKLFAREATRPVARAPAD